MTVTPAVEQPTLRRTLGLTDVALFFVVAGSNFQWIATAAIAGPSSLSVWVLGCLAMFVPLSIVVIFLSSHYPDEGGMYVWSKRAFGPFAGFITGWMYWTSNLPFFPALLYFAAGNALYLGGVSGSNLAASPTYFIVFAVLGLTFATAVNVLGLDVAKWLSNIGAVSRWIATLLLIAAGAFAWWKFGFKTPIDVTTLRPGVQVKDLIFFSVIAFAWTGPEAISFMAGEIKNPRRSIPIGLALAAPAIAVIYIAGTASILAVLSPSQIDASSAIVRTIARSAQLFGLPALAPLAAILVAVSCLGSATAWLGAAARIPFVAGIDRFLPAGFGRLHPRFGSPVTALLVQSAIATAFIFLGQGGTTVKGAYDVLVSTTVIATLLPFVFLFAAALRLHPVDLRSAYVRIPGGRTTVHIAAFIGLCTTLTSIVLGFVPSDDEPNKALAIGKIAGMTALMIGGGIAVYVSARMRDRQRIAEQN